MSCLGRLIAGGVSFAALAVPLPAGAGAPFAASGEGTAHEQQAAALVTGGHPRQVCLPPDEALRAAIGDPASQLVLVVSSYTPAEGGSGDIVVTAAGADAGPPLATFGLFPNTAIGPNDAPRKFFLPQSALVAASAERPLCFLVALGTEPGAAASVAIELQKF